MPQSQRTIVYVDGFNLYYGCLKDTPYRWLDLSKLCERLLNQTHDVVAIKYFTARMQERIGNPGQDQRQRVYLRALATLPGLSLQYGQFITRPAWRMLAKPPRRGNPMRQVLITEEKGSDVNLASHLLIDGFRARYDVAVVISNDSDLKEPVRFVREDLQAPVGILNPHPHKHRSWALSPPKLPPRSFYKPIRKGALSASQFPATLADRNGTITKPASW